RMKDAAERPPPRPVAPRGGKEGSGTFLVDHVADTEADLGGVDVVVPDRRAPGRAAGDGIAELDVAVVQVDEAVMRHGRRGAVRASGRAVRIDVVDVAGDEVGRTDARADVGGEHARPFAGDGAEIPVDVEEPGPGGDLGVFVGVGVRLARAGRADQPAVEVA